MPLGNFFSHKKICFSDSSRHSAHRQVSNSGFRVSWKRFETIHGWLWSYTCNEQCQTFPFPGKKILMRLILNYLKAKVTWGPIIRRLSHLTSSVNIKGWELENQYQSALHIRTGIKINWLPKNRRGYMKWSLVLFS